MGVKETKRCLSCDGLMKTDELLIVRLSHGRNELEERLRRCAF